MIQGKAKPSRGGAADRGPKFFDAYFPESYAPRYVSTPYAADFASLTGAKEDESILPSDDLKRYKALLCSLIYIEQDRLDLCYAVSRLCSFLTRPDTVCMRALNRLCAYLYHHRDLGVFSDCTSWDDWRLHGMVDTDWAGCVTTRRSQTGFIR